MENIYAGLCFFGSCIGGVLIGYSLARLDYMYVVLRAWHEHTPNTTGFFAQNAKKTKTKTEAAKVITEKIDIDARTVVTKIDTDTIQKGSDIELGKTTAQEDTINSSVSKLAQLKGR